MSNRTGSMTPGRVRKLRMGASSNHMPLDDYIDESEAEENEFDESKFLSIIRYATSIL